MRHQLGYITPSVVLVSLSELGLLFRDLWHVAGGAGCDDCKFGPGRIAGKPAGAGHHDE